MASRQLLEIGGEEEEARGGGHRERRMSKEEDAEREGCVKRSVCRKEEGNARWVKVLFKKRCQCL